MGLDGVGSSVVIALAAVLWLVYLVPTWLKRREYLATERNAVRLQQTMRIMAESAEVPDVVRVEATARSVAAQERALRSAHRSDARVDAAEPGRSSGTRVESPLAARRLRRSRALASLVLLVSLVAAGFGVFLLVSTGSWMLLAASLVVAAGALALLGQAASVARARAALRSVEVAAPVASELHDHADYAEEPRASWTPVPLPKPLYLSRPAPVATGDRSSSAPRARIETVPDPVDHAAILRAAAAEAERALRAAQSAPELARIERPAPATPAAPSRFARMGIIETTDAATTDLDDILRRRRAAG